MFKARVKENWKKEQEVLSNRLGIISSPTKHRIGGFIHFLIVMKSTKI